MTKLPETLAATLDAQRHLLTRSQARAAGLSDETIRWGLHSRWESVLPGVMLTRPAPLTEEQRLLAALLYAGPHSAIHSVDAASWWGLEHARDARGAGNIVRVVVPRRCSSRQVRWVRISRSAVPFDVYCDGAMRVVSAGRAVVEAAREAATEEQAEAIVIEALNRRRVRLGELAAMNDRLGRSGSALATRAIAAASAGVWSVPESQLAKLVRRSDLLPDMWSNPELWASDGRRLTSPDGWFDDIGLAIMVHSRRYHDGSAWVRTVERDSDLVACGVRVMQVAPASLAREPRTVLARIESTYAAARALGGRPDVRARRYAPR